MAIQSTITLNNGTVIPQIGLGVFRTPDGDTTVNAVQTALENGYRHIDTAMIYRNETSVGEGIRRSGVPRGDLFVAHRHPQRFFDVGMAEQHAVTFAAGLASQGMVPVVCIYTAAKKRSRRASTAWAWIMWICI